MHEIVLVGGSTCILRIVKLMSDFFDGKEPSKNINRDEAALPCGLLAFLSSGTLEKTQDFLLDAAPLSLAYVSYYCFYFIPYIFCLQVLFAVLKLL